jgi:hypothetical protein
MPEGEINMGYRSDIYIGCEEDCKELIEAILEAKPDFHEIDEGKFRASFEGWKWYDSYSYVGKIMSAMHRIEERECEGYAGKKYMDLPYGYMEIGEDYSDIIEEGRPYDYGINLVRHLEWI